MFLFFSKFILDLRGPPRPPWTSVDLREPPQTSADLRDPPRTSADLHEPLWTSANLRGPPEALRGGRFIFLL